MEILRNFEFRVLPVSTLVAAPMRDIRTSVLNTIKERISNTGYNNAKPLSVIRQNEKYLVADGNHRLKVIQDIGITEVPCIIYNGDNDIYKIGVKCNQDEDTYAPMDLFDWLGVIEKLKKDHTQEQIGEKIGWTRPKVSQYSMILDSVATPILNLAKEHQTGRVADTATNVALDFTEGWFREILKLNADNQKKIITEYIESKGKLRGKPLTDKVDKLLLYEDMAKYVQANVIDTSIDRNQIVADIYDEVFNTMEQLEKYVKQLNEKAQNKLINGDCLVELLNIPDKSISLVVTDPPYGINYKSNRRELENKVTTDIKGDGKDASKLLDDALSVISKKTVDDAHIYIFCSWKNYSESKQVVEKYYSIKNLLVWDKENHGAGDLEGNYGERYELIIFAGNGNRKLNGKRPDNILNYPKVPNNELEHPTQKPVELLKFLIEKSTSPGETVLDPFMGAGSVPLACVDRNPFIGIEIDERYFKIAQRRVR